MYRKCQYDTEGFDIFNQKNTKMNSNMYVIMMLKDHKNMFKYKYFYLSRFYLKNQNFCTIYKLYITKYF